MNERLVAIALLALAAATHAQTVVATPPPAAQAHTPTPTAPVGYDLAARLALVPFAVSLPAPPLITTRLTVSTDSELASALRTEGAEINVQPRAAGGCYVGLHTMRARDQRWIFASGAHLCSPPNSLWGGALTVQGQRIHLIGPGGVNAGSVYFAGALDLRLDGRFALTTKAEGNHDQVHMIGVQRMLVEGASIRSRTYCGYVQGARDLVIANSALVSEGGFQSCLRIVGSQRAVVMDSRLVNPTHHSFRVHSHDTNPSDLVYFARNQLEGGHGVMSNNSAGNPDPQSLRTWYVDNRLYGGQLIVAPAPGNVTAVMSGNQVIAGQAPPAWRHQ